MPLEFEIELVSDPSNPLASKTWRLENFMIKVDMCSLDNALDLFYVAHVISGKT
jgi:hypothetical protein